MLLYAGDLPYFVIDAYTKRIVERLNISKEKDYNKLQELFHKNLEKDHKLFNEYHALFVEHAKRYCKKLPSCGECILKNKCSY